jgi:hypothetical protein
MSKSKEDIKALLEKIGFKFKEKYISMTKANIEVYTMGIKIFWFQDDICMLNNEDENRFIFHIENDFALSYQTLTKIFISDVRKKKIKNILNE